MNFKDPSVAINPANPSNVVVATRSDVPDFGCQIWYSRDAGVTWAASQFPPPSEGTCWAPGAAFDDSGHAYVSAQDRPVGGGGPQQMIVWLSSNGGQNFSAPVRIPAASTAGSPPGINTERFAWQGGIALDNSPSSPHHGRVYVTWEYSAPFAAGPPHDRVNLAFSDDHGQTWSPKIEEASFPAGNEELPKLAVAPDGTVYVVYRASALKQTPPSSGTCNGFGFTFPAGSMPPYDCPVRVVRYSPAVVGQPFNATFDPGSDVQAAPARFTTDPAASEKDGIAVTPDGAVLVTYAAVPNPPAGSCSSLDVFVVRSAPTLRGGLWSAPVRLSDDPCSSGTSHRDPWISVAPNGRVDAIWSDNRNDSGHGFLYDTFYANSSDGGRTFGRNLRVTRHSFVANHLFTAASSGFQTNEYDTSNGIASTNDWAVGAWPDTRNDTGNTGLSDVFAARFGFLAPRCTVRAKSTQHLNRKRSLLTSVFCDQPVTGKEGGKVVLRGVPRLFRSKTYRLGKVTFSLASNHRTVIHMRVSRGLVDAIDSALSQGRRVSVYLTLTINDVNGRRTTVRVGIDRLKVPVD